MLHFPVLLEESVDFLLKDLNGDYIDCTFGRGGHSKLILKKLSKKGSLTSMDKDPDAYKYASKFKEKNFKIINDSFKNLDKYFDRQSIDGILYDLGTCSTHLDQAERGFSLNKDGPLDMRFDNKQGFPLSEWLQNASEEQIKEIIYNYGDEKHAKLISKAIFKSKMKNKIITTTQLSNIIRDTHPEKFKKIHPATKSFQAFRIFLNNELEELKESLKAAEKILKQDGFIVTIAFHSLEDNVIKNFFKPSLISFPKDIPINNQQEKKFQCVAKKVRASKDEININPRSRSAIMRVFQKI